MSRAQELANQPGNEEWKRYIADVGQKGKEAGGWLGQRAGEGWEGLNHVAKVKGGVDLNEQLSKLGISGSGAGGRGGGAYEGYGQVGQLNRAEGGVLTPHGGGGGKDDDFFEEWDDIPASMSGRSDQGLLGGAGGKTQAGQVNGKKNDGWDQEDEWKDF